MPREGRRPAMGVEETGSGLVCSHSSSTGELVVSQERGGQGGWLWGGRGLWKVYREGISLLAHCT